VARLAHGHEALDLGDGDVRVHEGEVGHEVLDVRSRLEGQQVIDVAAARIGRQIIVSDDAEGAGIDAGGSQGGTQRVGCVRREVASPVEAGAAAGCAGLRVTGAIAGCVVAAAAAGVTGLWRAVGGIVALGTAVDAAARVAATLLAGVLRTPES